MHTTLHEIYIVYGYNDVDRRGSSYCCYNYYYYCTYLLLYTVSRSSSSSSSGSGSGSTPLRIENGEGLPALPSSRAVHLLLHLDYNRNFPPLYLTAPIRPFRGLISVRCTEYSPCSFFRSSVPPLPLPSPPLCVEKGVGINCGSYTPSPLDRVH